MKAIDALIVIHREILQNPDKMDEFIDIILPGTSPIKKKIYKTLAGPALAKVILKMKEKENETNKI